MRSALTAMADMFRLAMLRAAIQSPSGLDRPPGMIVVSATGEITAISAAAHDWLDAIDDRDRIPSAVRSVAAAASGGDGLAHAAFPVPEGRWVILHASPLGGRDGGIGIIIEGAQPVTLSEVIASAYALTPREREITAFAAQGRSTKQIASALGISPFTVQDTSRPCSARSACKAAPNSWRRCMCGTTSLAGRPGRPPARTAGTSTTIRRSPSEPAFS